MIEILFVWFIPVLLDRVNELKYDAFVKCSLM